MQLDESPVFQKMKDEGTTSKAPLTEAFARWGNARWVLIALLGAVAGQAVVWYTGQFYALFFLEKTLKVDGATANMLIAVALALGTPFFVLFGWLVDRIGRKPIILAGCALAALTYFPAFQALTMAANPALAAAQARAPVMVHADPATARCNSIRWASRLSTRPAAMSPRRLWPRPASPMETHRAGRAKSRSARPGSSRAISDLRQGAERGGKRRRLSGQGRSGGGRHSQSRRHPVLARAAGDHGLWPDCRAAGRAVPQPHPLHLDVAALSYRQRLVRRLPADRGLRHGRGDGDIYYGLWYPIVVAAGTLVIGLLFLPETFRRDIDG